MNPPPPGTRSIQEAALRELAAVLMSDPWLAGAVRQWRRFSADRDDPGDGPVTPECCPMVRLMPVAGGSGATRIGSDGLLTLYSAPLGVQVETVVAAVDARGPDAGAALALAEAICRAAWPRDRAARAAADARFRAAGVADVVLRQPILPVYYDDLFIGSRGLIELTQTLHL